MRITEDAVWRHYNCPDPPWSAKCRSCREKIAKLRAPVQECVDCWKVEIWKHGPALAECGDIDFDRLMEGIDVVLSSRAVRSSGREHDVAPSLPVAKASRAPIQVVRTGIPESGYGDLIVDDLLVLYAGSISEREALRDLVRAALDLPASAAWLIPVRRGCWRFDSVLGPWQGWHPVDSDWQRQ